MIRLIVLHLWLLLLLLPVKGWAQKFILSGDSVARLALGQEKVNLSSALTQMHLLGYLDAQPDSSCHQKLCIISGRKYNIKEISVADSEGWFLNLSEESKKLKYWPGLAQRFLKNMEDNGFPFATVSLQPVFQQDSTVSLYIRSDPGKYIVFDTFDVVGDAAVKKIYLTLLLNIKPGEPYNESLVEQMDRKLSDVPWINLTAPSEIFFSGSKALIRIHANKRQAGNLDAILGLAPASQLNNEQLLITGEAHLKLPNLFSRGIAVETDYTSYRASSREFRARLYIPYIFKTSLGAEGVLNLVKFDSLYLDVNSELGLLYQFNSNEFIRFYFRNQQVSLLTLDTPEVRSSRKIPSFNDARLNRYGLMVRLNRLDYIRNPLKGVSLEVDASAGAKKIIEMEGVKQLSVYEGVALKSIQYQGNILFNGFIPLSRFITFHIQLRAAGIYAPLILYNDLYRIGGLRTLRGFDEQSILTSSYVLGNAELRYLFGKYSHAMVFYNGGWWENNAVNVYKNGKPVGVGFGANLETRAGVFSIFYALGKEWGQGFMLRNGKVHFGLVSYF